LAGILNKGGFLPEIEYPWLDKFKAIISSGSINALLPQLDHSSPQDTIHLCDAVLQSDGLCEEAIHHKCKALIAMRQHASAKKIYTDFTKSYEELYGETYEKPYSEIIEQVTMTP
jgi:two-component SAPR family response regulator